MNKEFDLIVIGGGPAGMIAAITASLRKKQTLLIEKNSSLGKKLLISGKGRCNLTNIRGDVGEFLKQFSSSGRFLRNAFSRYFNTDLIKFFEKEGLPLKIEQGGRVFPQSNRAKDVLRVLSDALKASGAEVLLNAEPFNFRKVERGFLVKLKNKDTYFAAKLLLATGGCSYPQTGSDGSGFKIAKMMGHTLVDAKPALTGINLSSNLALSWQGVSLKNVECRVLVNKKTVNKEFGEMLFTHFGVSGPIILDLSASVFDLVKEKKTVSISIDFKPALSHEKLDKRLLREFSNCPTMSLSNILKELLPRRLIKGILTAVTLDGTKKANQISKDERLRLVNILKGLRFSVRDVRPLAEAIVTRGGVSTREINPKTMESKIIPGLYFAGELIDLDAKTGGYNMQAAFSTGYIVGVNV